MKIEAFIIHLQRATSRLGQVEELLRHLPVSSHILKAVDGQSLSANQIAAVYWRNLHKPYYPFELRLGEIACFLSHRNAWQEIVDRGLDAALILEDDVDLVPGVFDAAFNLAVAKVTGDPAYIQFGLRSLKGSVQTLACDGDVSIVRPEIIPLRTTAQLVTREAAKILLQHTSVFDRPIDVFLQLHWLSGIHPVTVVPSGLIDRTRDIGGTTIHSSKEISERLMREWGRFVYRWNIRRLSRLYKNGPIT